MENINKLSSLITETFEMINNINLTELFSNINNQIQELENNNKKLNLLIEEKNREIQKLVNKYDNDINIRDEKLKEKSDELANFTKISLMQSLHKELNEKNNYIQILESQIEKMKNNKTSNLNNEKNKVKISEPEKELLDDNLLDKNKTNQTEKELLDDNLLDKNKEIDPDNFDDINGYELIIYKKKYYLRDLETNELYNITDNKPDTVVGFINSKGKVKFN